MRGALGTALDLRLEALALGSARVRLPWGAVVVNPYGAMHGGALATTCDVAAYLAIMTRYGVGETLITTALNVAYLAAAREPGDVEAEATVLHAGRLLATAVVRLTSGDRLCAHATLTFARPSGRAA